MQKQQKQYDLGYKIAKRLFARFESAKVHWVYNLQYFILTTKSKAVYTVCSPNVMDFLQGRFLDDKFVVLEKNFIAGIIGFLNERDERERIERRNKDARMQAEENKRKNDFLRSKNMIPFYKEDFIIFKC